MGEERLLDTIKFWTTSVGDYLNEYFETDVIKAQHAGSGIIGTALGVYSRFFEPGPYHPEFEATFQKFVGWYLHHLEEASCA